MLCVKADRIVPENPAGKMKQHRSHDSLRKGKHDRIASAQKIAPEAAKELAIQAFAYLAGEPERIAPFFASAGVEPSEIRAVAREPGFLAGVLDYITANEQLLLGFADETGCDPALIGRARATLSGQD